MLVIELAGGFGIDVFGVVGDVVDEHPADFGHFVFQLLRVADDARIVRAGKAQEHIQELLEIDETGRNLVELLYFLQVLCGHRVGGGQRLSVEHKAFFAENILPVALRIVHHHFAFRRQAKRHFRLVVLPDLVAFHEFDCVRTFAKTGLETLVVIRQRVGLANETFQPVEHPAALAERKEFKGADAAQVAFPDGFGGQLSGIEQDDAANECRDGEYGAGLGLVHIRRAGLRQRLVELVEIIAAQPVQDRVQVVRRHAGIVAHLLDAHHLHVCLPGGGEIIDGLAHLRRFQRHFRQFARRQPQRTLLDQARRVAARLILFARHQQYIAGTAAHVGPDHHVVAVKSQSALAQGVVTHRFGFGQRFFGSGGRHIADRVYLHNAVVHGFVEPLVFWGQRTRIRPAHHRRGILVFVEFGAHFHPKGFQETFLAVHSGIIVFPFQAVIQFTGIGAHERFFHGQHADVRLKNRHAARNLHGFLARNHAEAVVLLHPRFKLAVDNAFVLEKVHFVQRGKLAFAIESLRSHQENAPVLERERLHHAVRGITQARVVGAKVNADGGAAVADVFGRVRTRQILEVFGCVLGHQVADNLVGAAYILADFQARHRLVETVDFVFVQVAGFSNRVIDKLVAFEPLFGRAVVVHELEFVHRRAFAIHKLPLVVGHDAPRVFPAFEERNHLHRRVVGRNLVVEVVVFPVFGNKIGPQDYVPPGIHRLNLVFPLNGCHVLVAHEKPDADFELVFVRLKFGIQLVIIFFALQQIGQPVAKQQDSRPADGQREIQVLIAAQVAHFQVVYGGIVQRLGFVLGEELRNRFRFQQQRFRVNLHGIATRIIEVEHAIKIKIARLHGKQFLVRSRKIQFAIQRAAFLNIRGLGLYFFGKFLGKLPQAQQRQSHFSRPVLVYFLLERWYPCRNGFHQKVQFFQIIGTQIAVHQRIVESAVPVPANVRGVGQVGVRSRRKHQRIRRRAANQLAVVIDHLHGGLGLRVVAAQRVGFRPQVSVIKQHPPQRRGNGVQIRAVLEIQRQRRRNLNAVRKQRHARNQAFPLGNERIVELDESGGLDIRVFLRVFQREAVKPRPCPRRGHTRNHGIERGSVNFLRGHVARLDALDVGLLLVEAVPLAPVAVAYLRALN